MFVGFRGVIFKVDTDEMKMRSSGNSCCLLRDVMTFAGWKMRKLWCPSRDGAAVFRRKWRGNVLRHISGHVSVSNWAIKTRRNIAQCADHCLSDSCLDKLQKNESQKNCVAYFPFRKCHDLHYKRVAIARSPK